MFTYGGPGGEEQANQARAQGKSKQLEAVHLHIGDVVIDCCGECQDAKLR
jgi:hypothetical protein